MAESPYPRTAVAAVFSNKDGNFLVGKRKCKLGAGTLQFPGGHLKYGEKYQRCAERETLEETGLKVMAAEKEFAITNNIFETQNKHYTTIFMHCTMVEPNAVPSVTEEYEWWKWMLWAELKRIHQAAKSDPSVS